MFLLFSKKGCPACMVERMQAVELKKKDALVRVIDITTVAGMAEANFYGIQGVPMWVLIDEDGNEIKKQHTMQSS